VCRLLLASLNIGVVPGSYLSPEKKDTEQITRGNGMGDAYTATLA